MDLEQPVYGVDVAAAPLDSAYTQWDVNPMPVPPDVNLPPPTDNGAHTAIRQLPLLVDQLKAFMTPTGQVTQTCSGLCVFYVVPLTLAFVGGCSGPPATILYPAMGSISQPSGKGQLPLRRRHARPRRSRITTTPPTGTC